MVARAFNEVLTEAVRDMAAHGYDSAERVAYWLERIRLAAEASLVPEHEMVDALKRTLGATYARLVDKDGLLRTNPGVAKWTLAKVKPQLRGELDRRECRST